MGSAKTPRIVGTAFWANTVLLLVALAAPAMLTGSEAAAMLFAIPMALILVVGTAAVIRAYILARRENLSMRWTALLPLSLFLLGIAGTLLLVYRN